MLRDNSNNNSINDRKITDSQELTSATGQLDYLLNLDCIKNSSNGFIDIQSLKNTSVNIKQGADSKQLALGVFFVEDFQKFIRNYNKEKNFNIMDFYGQYLEKLLDIPNAMICICTYLNDQKLEEDKKPDESDSESKENLKIEFVGRVFEGLKVTSSVYKIDFTAQKVVLPQFNFKELFEKLGRHKEFKKFCMEINTRIEEYLQNEPHLHGLKKEIFEADELALRFQKIQIFEKLYQNKYNECLDNIVLECLNRQKQQSTEWRKFQDKLIEKNIKIENCEELMMSCAVFPITFQMNSHMKVNQIKKNPKEILFPKVPSHKLLEFKFSSSSINLFHPFTPSKKERSGSGSQLNNTTKAEVEIRDAEKCCVKK